jgi:uncharacterized repeat protein (TIGR01451 family)
MKNWKNFPRVTLIGLLAMLLAGFSAPVMPNQSASAAPRRQAATSVVISEFRTTSTDEFIELYNPTSSTISLSGLKLRSSSSCGGTLNDIYVFPSGINLLSGQYYLVAGLNYTGTIFDVRLITDMNISDTGGIAITDASDTPIDQVGMCVGTTYIEGAPLADLTTTTGQSYERYLGGTLDSCQDAANNSIDFQPINPSNPQSSATPQRLCGVSADLSVAQSVNNSTPSVNDSVVFTIAVRNTGPDTATSVIINDDLPAGLTYVSDTGGGTYNSSTGEWTISSLTPGPSPVVLKITAKVITTGAKTNIASVLSSGQVDPNISNNSASVTVTPSGGVANLSLTQKPTNSTSIAGYVVLTIKVSNAGPYSATNVVVKDDLPDGLTYVSDDSGGAYNRTTGLWSVGVISFTSPSGDPTKDYKELNITVKVDSTGSRVNWAEVWSADQSPTPAFGAAYGNSSTTEPDDDSVTVLSADLSLTKSMDNVTPSLGQDVVFTIRVNNAGPDNATNVQVKDVLPANFAYLSDDSLSNGGSYNKSTGIWTVGTTINSGLSKTLKITANMVTASIAVNWAEVWKSDQIDIDSVPGNNSTNTDDDASAPSADLRIDQAVSTSTPGLNTNFTYIITVTNDGTVGTTGVEVKDLLPSGVTYVSYSSSAGTYDNSTGIWKVGALYTGASASATLSIIAKLTSSGVYTNWAEVWKSDLPDPDSTPGNSSRTEDDDASGTVSFSSIIINEVAWAGTAASADDEWMELYNPSSSSIDITGWTLRSTSNSVNITLSGTISSGGYFLLEREDDLTVSDITADQIYPGLSLNRLSDSGEKLTLYDKAGNIVDTANQEGSGSTTITNPWPKGAGSDGNYGSMERQGTSAETDSSWVTNRGNPRNGLNANNGLIYGTPRKYNSAGLPPDPTPTPVVPVYTLVPRVGRPIINEFLSRPGFDWNGDGKVNTFDEFIEVKNIGNADISLSGWTLDDEANRGSSPYSLPSVTLKVGERMVFYGLQTNILLGDGGDTVRLINPSGKIYDAYTYLIAKVEDKSTCRLPDGNGSWYEDCIPTPNLTNSREGIVPSMPGGSSYQSPVCDLPDTLLYDFLFAECRGYGADIWYSFYWDKTGWQGDRYIHDKLSKWESFVQ